MAGDQGWMDICNDPQTWRMLIDRAARTLCYVFANRLLFYESVRRKFDVLGELRVPKTAGSVDGLYTHFLKDNGWFGFLVSSSWLDVEYGFALQSWVLTNFRIHAILESNAEPWFEDARVKTCAVILQKCNHPAERNKQLVKFVRLDAPLKTILGERPDENARQTAAEEFRAEMLACKKNTTRNGWRVVVKKQQDLWEEGLRAGRLFEMQKQRDLAEGVKSANPTDGEDEEGEENGAYDENGNGLLHDEGGIGYGPK
jgi:hypothetical protein